LSPSGIFSPPNPLNSSATLQLATHNYTTANADPVFEPQNINDHINNLLNEHNIPTSPETSTPTQNATPNSESELSSQSTPTSGDTSNSETKNLDALSLVPLDSKKFPPNAKLSCVHCFCDKVYNPDKPIQLVCVHDDVEPDQSSVVAPDSTNNPISNLHMVVESLVREVRDLKRELRGEEVPVKNNAITPIDQAPRGPAVAVWDLISQQLMECNETFASMFSVDRSQPNQLHLFDIAQCPAYFLRLCSSNKPTWHEKRRFSLKRPEGDINLVVAIDVNGTCVVSTLWKT